MKCPHCNKEFKLKTRFESDIPGAVIIACSSDSMSAAWPAQYGLTKHLGCVDFGCQVGSCAYKRITDVCCDGYGLCLDSQECKDLYFDAPKGEEAWLVIPVKGGYEWERIDNQLEFS